MAPILEAGLAEAVFDGADLGGGPSTLGLEGRSPGQVGLRLTHAQGEAIFCGDAIHSAAQLRLPDWRSAFCADPAAAVATRTRPPESAEASGAAPPPGHVRGPSPAFAPRSVRGAGRRPVWLRPKSSQKILTPGLHILLRRMWGAHSARLRRIVIS